MKSGYSELLRVDEMYAADAAAIRGGVSGIQLMQSAGEAISDAIKQRWTACAVTILCGPGNNGGDGFVVARLLSESGWPVRLGLIGQCEALKGDAAHHASLWQGPVESLSLELLDDCSVVVDALYGAGLTRPVDGIAADLIDEINRRNMACVAVDVPSGIDGNTGEIRGVAPKSTLTVSFFRAKPGHYLYPGRGLCGEIVIADIGIPDSVLSDINPQVRLNTPLSWVDNIPVPGPDSHKYNRGHTLISGGELMTGAARMAAMAARRIGSGMVTLAVPPSVVPIYACSNPGNLIVPLAADYDCEGLFSDSRISACLVGPGMSTGHRTRHLVMRGLQSGKQIVLDADALTEMATHQDEFFDLMNDNCLLTPHEGEFARLFEIVGDKIFRTQEAARECGAVVLLKGPDSVIASPDGAVTVNATGSGWLATAGSGDVLAGIAAGLMAQNLSAYEAGCAAAWIHGRAGELFGPGLIAEDLPDLVPEVLLELLGEGG